MHQSSDGILRQSVRQIMNCYGWQPKKHRNALCMKASGSWLSRLAGSVDDTYPYHANPLLRGDRFGEPVLAVTEGCVHGKSLAQMIVGVAAQIHTPARGAGHPSQEGTLFILISGGIVLRSNDAF